jgi:hypothetical protein
LAQFPSAKPFSHKLRIGPVVKLPREHLLFLALRHGLSCELGGRLIMPPAIGKSSKA